MWPLGRSHLLCKGRGAARIQKRAGEEAIPVAVAAWISTKTRMAAGLPKNALPPPSRDSTTLHLHCPLRRAAAGSSKENNMESNTRKKIVKKCNKNLKILQKFCCTLQLSLGALCCRLVVRSSCAAAKHAQTIAPCGWYDLQFTAAAMNN